MLLKIVASAIIVLAAMFLYTVSTNMINKERKKGESSGCSGNCTSCSASSCTTRLHDEMKN